MTTQQQATIRVGEPVDDLARKGQAGGHHVAADRSTSKPAAL
jgi:hypothetical protein